MPLRQRGLEACGPYSTEGRNGDLDMSVTGRIGKAFRIVTTTERMSARTLYQSLP